MGIIAGTKRGKYKTPLIGRRGLIRAVKQDMCLRICPVTGGQQTRMTLKSWKRMCAYHIKRARARKITSAIDNDPISKFCRKCKGKVMPKELEIIDKEVMPDGLMDNENAISER